MSTTAAQAEADNASVRRRLTHLAQENTELEEKMEACRVVIANQKQQIFELNSKINERTKDAVSQEIRALKALRLLMHIEFELVQSNRDLSDRIYKFRTEMGDTLG